ncbi:unnamed protein product, partial [Owenia fusiformis]
MEIGEKKREILEWVSGEKIIRINLMRRENQGNRFTGEWKSREQIYWGVEIKGTDLLGSGNQGNCQIKEDCIVSIYIHTITTARYCTSNVTLGNSSNLHIHSNTNTSHR